MNKKNTPQALPLLRALAEPVRIRIYLLLKKAPLTVSELSEILTLSQSNTSHHVKALRAVDLLLAEKIGQHTYYDIDTIVLKKPQVAHLFQTIEELGYEITETKSDTLKLKSVLAARTEGAFTRWRMEQPDLPYSDIFAHLAAGCSGTVLDIGCGEGDFFEALRVSFCHVIGIDINMEHLQKAYLRTHALENTAVFLADSAQIPFKENAVDAVVLRMALSQMQDAPKALTEAMRVLKPNGFVSIIDSDQKWGDTFRQSVFDFIEKNPHLKIDYQHIEPRIFLLRAQKKI